LGKIWAKSKSRISQKHSISYAYERRVYHIQPATESEERFFLKQYSIWFSPEINPNPNPRTRAFTCPLLLCHWANGGWKRSLQSLAIFQKITLF